MRKILKLQILKKIVEKASLIQDGNVATYIPELANVNKNVIGIAIYPLGGKPILYSNMPIFPITLQSTAKMITLIGLLEEFGVNKLNEWVKVEPSGDDFDSITHLEQFGPRPSNPMLNAGAITLCSHIPGTKQQKFCWLEHWVKKLFNQKLNVNPLVFNSEKKTGDRNRSLAYLLKSRNILGSDIETTLDLYFTLCSYEAKLNQMLYLPTLLANGGRDPNNNFEIISIDTCKVSLAIMATCGLYDETGTHMVKTGIPAKSGVSGYTIASVVGKAGITVLGTKVNSKGNSVRGEMMLEEISKEMGWHFAIP